jgi:hypothetical protein
MYRQDEAAFADLSLSPYVTPRPCAVMLITCASYLPAHSRAFYVFSTLRAISENNLSYVMYTVHLHPTFSLLTYLADTTGTRPRPILRKLFFARSFFMAVPADGRRARGVAEPMRRRRQRADSEDVQDTARCSLQCFRELLRTLRGLEPRPVLRARRQPGPPSHPHVRPRRRLRRADIPAMLRTRR